MFLSYIELLLQSFIFLNILSCARDYNILLFLNSSIDCNFFQKCNLARVFILVRVNYTRGIHSLILPNCFNQPSWKIIYSLYVINYFYCKMCKHMTCYLNCSRYKRNRALLEILC